MLGCDDGGMDDEMLPSEHPDLAGVWSELTETERLQLQLMNEPVPEALDDAVRRMFPGRP